MARKPAPSLPDVFARPGGAPPRGTAIEDLPQPEVAQAVLAAEPEPAEQPAAPRPIEPAPPPTDFYRPAVKTQPMAPAVDRRPLTLALVALTVSLTAPFWEDSLLSVVGIRTPAARAVEQNSLAVARQERKSDDISQRLSATSAQIARQQADFATAAHRMDRSATLIRTLALVRLSETLRRPMPFAADLAVVRASGADLGDMKALLEQIGPYAATGIPGVTQLRQDFHALQDQVSRRGPATSWVGSIAAWTRIGASAPRQPMADPAADLLRTASARVAEADFAGALEQTRQLSESDRQMFASWNDDAQARVAADSIADRVGDMVAQSLREGR